MGRHHKTGLVHGIVGGVLHSGEHEDRHEDRHERHRHHGGLVHGIVGEVLHSGEDEESHHHHDGLVHNVVHGIVGEVIHSGEDEESHHHHDELVHNVVHGIVGEVLHIGEDEESHHHHDELVHNVVGEVLHLEHNEGPGLDQRLGIRAHREPRWVGQELPGIGVPSRILQFYPEKVDDKHIKLMPNFTVDDSDEGEAVKDLMFSLANKFGEFFDVVHKEIVIEEGIKASHDAAKVAGMFIPSISGGIAFGIATEVATATAKAKREKILHDKGVEFSDVLADMISSANTQMKESAAATGASTYLSAALCEQSVSLNSAQAVALFEELDVTNTTTSIDEAKAIGKNRTMEEKVTNRFSVFEFCPIEHEENVEIFETEDLQYDVPQAHFAQLKVVKIHGKTEIVSTGVATLQNTVGMAFQPLVKKGEAARAEVMNHRCLPSYGDFIIRRFVFLFRVPFEAGRGQMKPLIHLPPVYTGMDPNVLDTPMSDLMYPIDVFLGPGEVPPHMTYDEDRRLNRREAKKTYELYDVKTGKATTVKN